MNRSEEIDILMRDIFRQIRLLSNPSELKGDSIHAIFEQIDKIKSKVNDFFDLKDEIYKDKS